MRRGVAQIRYGAGHGLMPKISVAFVPEVMALLRTRAEERGVPIAEVVRDLVNGGLGFNQRRIAAETARGKAPDARNAAPGSGGGSGGETRSAGAGEEGR